MERVERITEMEEKLHAALAAVRAMESALDLYAEAQEEIRALEAYYTGDAWRADFEADEQGLLPEGLRRGVLSEDGIAQLLDENDELRQHLREIL